MNLRRFATLILAFIAAGCGGETHPPPLPSLDRPIPGPPPEPTLGVTKTLTLTLENLEGRVIQEIPQQQKFRVRLHYELEAPIDQPPPKIRFRLVRYDQRRTATIADENTGRPESKDQKNFVLLTDLQSPPIAGEFFVIAVLGKSKTLAEAKLLVLDPE